MSAFLTPETNTKKMLEDSPTIIVYVVFHSFQRFFNSRDDRNPARPYCIFPLWMLTIYCAYLHSSDVFYHRGKNRMLIGKT